MEHDKDVMMKIRCDFQELKLNKINIKIKTFILSLPPIIIDLALSINEI